MGFPFKIKPDIAAYPVGSKLSGPTDSAKVEIFIELKWNPNDDPFSDPHDIQRDDGTTVKSFFHETKTAVDTLGQITAYAAAQLGSQFRTHIYSILIVKGKARILRWDRSGTIVTEAIEYNKSPLLAEFFRRYSKAPPEMRGADKSASAPTSEEASAAMQVLGLGSTVPLVKLEIPSADGSPQFFVVLTPRATPYTPLGRATRGFHAYDISQKARVFLKDSWRVDLPDIQAEGLTYKMLMDAHVRNIPQCLVLGDISSDLYHATKTFAYSNKPWACHTEAHLIPHQHYRLTLDIIGRSLMEFQSSYEMVATVRDALVGEFP